MKHDWEIKKLGEVCRLMVDGDWIESKDQSDNGIRLLQTGNVGIGCFKDKSEHYKFISEETFDRLNCTEIFEGDILISRLPEPIGRACIVPALDYRMITAVDCSIIRLKDIVLPKYVVYYTRSNKYGSSIEQYVTGAVRKRISRSNLAKIPIPVPERAEQERIVGELDCLSGIIAAKRAQLRELDTLAQSIFYTMFGDPITNDKGWQTKKLKDSVFEMFLGPFGSALKTECYVDKADSFCVVYEQKHAIKKLLDVETHYINEEKYNSLKRFEVHAGDFIMSCRGTIGELFRLPSNAPMGIIHPSLMKIRINEDVYNPIFFLWLLTRIVKNENTNGNCVQMAITAKELGKRIPIVPPIDLQQQFAEKIENIERQKELITKSIKETEDLFNSRMDYYFN